MQLRTAMALGLMLLAPLAVRAMSVEGALALEPVEVSEHRDAHGHVGIMLTFKRLPLDRNQVPLTREDVRAILAAFEKVYGQQSRYPCRITPPERGWRVRRGIISVPIPRIGRSRFVSMIFRMIARPGLFAALDELAKDICSPGSKLNRLSTKTP